MYKGGCVVVCGLGKARSQTRFWSSLLVIYKQEMGACTVRDSCLCLLKDSSLIQSERSSIKDKSIYLKKFLLPWCYLRTNVLRYFLKKQITIYIVSVLFLLSPAYFPFIISPCSTVLAVCQIQGFTAEIIGYSLLEA